MKTEDIKKKLKEVYDYLKEMGYSPIYIALYGSQNYNLDVYEEGYKSDFDFKTIVLPSLGDLVTNSKPKSIVLDYKDGQIDIKDIRSFTETVIKMNPAYLEILITPYAAITNEGKVWYNTIKSQIDNLLKERALLFSKACCGLFYEKKKAMCKIAPSSAVKIEKYGYDGKQAHHAYRILLMLKEFEQSKKMVLVPSDEHRELLLLLKTNSYTLEQVEKSMEEWEKEINEIHERIKAKYPEVSNKAADEFVFTSQEVMFRRCCADALHIATNVFENSIASLPITKG